MSLTDGLPDLWAAVDAGEVEEEDHEHGEEGDKDVDEGDDHHLGRNMSSLSLSRGYWIKCKLYLGLKLIWLKIVCSVDLYIN